jgi:hypothetical protein
VIDGREDAVSIEREEAGAMLADVESVVARVKQSRLYRRAATILILWGVISVVGDCADLLMPRGSGWVWGGLEIFGVAATVFLVRRGARGWLAPRFVGAFALFYGFGLVWSDVVGSFGPRQMDAFWSTLFLFGYALAGLWFGAAFAAFGLGLTALIIAGYLWSDDWFPLWMVFAHGGGMVLCGLWMRRA